MSNKHFFSPKKKKPFAPKQPILAHKNRLGSILQVHKRSDLTNRHLTDFTELTGRHLTDFTELTKIVEIYFCLYKVG
jgi:hypothetical protein